MKEGRDFLTREYKFTLFSCFRAKQASEQSDGERREGHVSLSLLILPVAAPRTRLLYSDETVECSG